jgi:hypothetical protein
LDNLIKLSLLRQTGAFREISALQNSKFIHFPHGCYLLALQAIHQRCAPRLLAYVRHTKDVLMANDPTLRDNCTGGAFPAVEFFLGNDESPPTLHDLDMMWSWRALTALGKYDARWGGELILWDEKKIFKFPPGATFLFPGRLIRYSFTQVRRSSSSEVNTTHFIQVRSGEMRYSFGQYAQAGLFRYVENRFMSEANFEATAWKLQRKARDRLRDARMVKALGMYSLLNEIYQ